MHFGFSALAVSNENIANTIGAKMAVSLRGYDMDLSPLKHNNLYEHVWKSVDKVHTISRYLYTKALELGLDESKDYQIITPALEPEKYHYNFNSTSEPIVLLTIARLHWIKGLLDTIEALKILKDQGVLFNYYIIGDGPQEDEIKGLITKYNLEKYVTMVGKVPHHSVKDYLSKAHVYLQYSISEGFCNAVLEAQASGLLCVVSDGGGLPENVLDGKTGWIVPRKNPKALAETIFKVLHLDDNNKEKITRAARNRIEKEFDLSNQRQQFHEFYSQL